MKAEKAADFFRLMRLAIEFEGVRTIPAEDLPRGKVAGMVSPLIANIREDQGGSLLVLGDAFHHVSHGLSNFEATKLPDRSVHL